MRLAKRVGNPLSGYRTRTSPLLVLPQAAQPELQKGAHDGENQDDPQDCGGRDHYKADRLFGERLEFKGRPTFSRLRNWERQSS